MSPESPPGTQPDQQLNTATLPDSGEDLIHRIAAPLIANGWRRRDAIRQARKEILRQLSTRPDPYRNHRQRDVTYTDGTAPTALWDIDIGTPGTH